MVYFPAELPPPEPTPEDAGYWRCLSAGRLCFQVCLDCGRFSHPPGYFCPYCQSADRGWREAPPRGILYSYTIVHAAAHPAVAAAVPYNVAVVDFPDCDHVRLITNVLDAPPAALRIGQPVAVVLERLPNGITIPRARLLPVP